MAHTDSSFLCQSCGVSAHKWAGQCPGCGEWNTLVERAGSGRSAMSATASPAVALADVDAAPQRLAPTGVEQLDAVLGGGLVPGSVTLLGGEPGIGKSTLLVQAAGAIARGDKVVLYVSAEESVAQVRERAGRLRSVADGVFITDAVDVHNIIAEIDKLRPDVVIVDSIQSVYQPSQPGTSGSVTQVREAAQSLVRVARATSTSIVLVGHVTKEGNLAGPRVLEHVVDTVLTFEGDRHHALRFLRAVKHRFGSTRGLGVFEMGPTGLVSVDDPSRLFLADRRPGVPGSIVAPVMEGNRPLLVEVQALVVETPLASPRRVVQGFDQRRLSLLLAVLERRCGIVLGKADVFVSVVGGAKVSEPGADLPVALAVVSAFLDEAIDPDIIACGEVGLGGEVRQVTEIDRRLAEAARLGFSMVIVPSGSPVAPGGLRVRRAIGVEETLGRLGFGVDRAREIAG